MKNYIFIIIFTLICKICVAQTSWEITYGGSTFFHTDISFINPNTGFACGISNTTIRLLKTTNKGLNWALINSYFVNNTYQKNSSIFFKTEAVGYISYANKILKFNNGDTSTVFTFPSVSRWHKIRFVNDLTGYALFSRLGESPAYLTEVIIYKTTDGGNSWFSPNQNGLLTQTGQNRFSELRDIDFSHTNPDTVHAVGFMYNGSSYQSIHIYSTNGFNNRTVAGDGISGSWFGHIFVTPNNEIKILGNKGFKINNLGSTTYSTRYDFGNTTNVPELGITFINNEIGYVSLQSGKIMSTTNGGYNWNLEQNTTSVTDPYLGSRICNFGEIIYYGSVVDNNFYTRKLSTNLNTYHDNQSSSGTLSFDWTNYSTPTNEYLRGGYSSLNCSDLINSGQTNERIFYKWSDGFMKASHSIDTSNGKDFYFDASGTTIANYYKTKQLSTTSGAISNVRQTKVLKDEWGAINQIHQSLDGGIFYTKSYDNGGSYKREEIVNATTTHSIADGNKNPALCETNWYGTLAGGYPVNKNVTACWERYNSSNGMTEIKVAVRSYDIYTDTAFKWNNWEDGSYSDVFASFNSSSNYNSFPKIFASALDPVNYLGEPSTYFFAIPHLRPYQGGNKLVVSCRKGQNLAADFVLDSGDISDLAVVDTVGSPGGGAILIHFAYRKVNQILYRQELFQYQTVYPNSEMIGTYHYEGPKDVTTGDGGYPARLTPDISIMNGIPVITYAANYNAYRIVEFEDNTTTSLTVDRYPIVKVQRINANTWSNYVIYSSNNTQSSPDIEGSKTTRSYIINYNINNNQFKKVANVENYPGYFCSPNTFAGTDSRLVNNSYTGSFGSNMSLLTLSPQSSLYIIGKQNFVITNHNPIETFDIDNIQGVVSSDSIRYSFKLGPIFVQDNSSNEEIPVGPTAPPEQDPILTSIEFNENLRSQPFLLNETNPLLVSSNATYLKDNAYHSITEIPYTVKLINKRTDTLHRILYQDTIHAGDSMETEYMRGFYISDIPNGEDSFYVKLDVDETFNDAAYYVNPIYEDEYDTEGDNSGRSLAIIFENKNKLNVNSLKPNEYSLTQNYPNPFNPSTIIQYSIPNDVWVNVRVYDISGREISSLVNEFKTTGTYLIKFDGSNFASGIYFYRIEAVDNSSKKFVQTKRMVLVK